MVYLFLLELPIWELKNLETLDLQVSFGNGSSLNNVHNLKKLKRLRVHGNILQHLQFGVFDNLEELEAPFRGVFLEAVQEMKRIVPNLKNLVIFGVNSSVTINGNVTGKFGKLGIHQN
jgi:hypothetical protein